MKAKKRVIILFIRDASHIYHTTIVYVIRGYCIINLIYKLMYNIYYITLTCIISTPTFF